MIARWLREPLLHFLLVGALLFVAWKAVSPDSYARGAANRIVLTDDDLKQLATTWIMAGRAPPSPEQMQRLVDDKVREEVLYREALALGLDKDDTIVKRQLARKMEFLAEDVSKARDPKPGELRAWFAKNSDRFALPPRASFQHLYFSPDRRGARARDDAARALAKLDGKPADSAIVAALADPFMFQDHYGDRSPEQLANVFGPQFAQALFQLKQGSWQGPIESGYGWHLVWIDSMMPGRVPAFEEVEPDVKSEWIAEQSAEAKRKAFEAMRARYEVVLPQAQVKEAAGAPKK